jgi:hypothetical protein
VNSSGAVIDWGDVPFTAKGGQYALCWCAASSPGLCSQFEEFRTQMGSLTLIGTAPLFQDRTCVSGITCSLDGIIGQDLSSSDHLMILETCGESKVVSHMVRSGLIEEIASTGASLNWGETPMKAQGGEYRMCWCTGAATMATNASSFPSNDTGRACVTLSDFRVDTGRFLVVGMSPFTQDRTCVSGQSCSIDGLTGSYLSQADKILLLDTCGQNTFIERMHGPTNLEVYRSSMADNSTGMDNTSGAVVSASADWEGKIVTVKGGQYRLCWCGAGSPCSLAEHFRIDAGRIDILGPSPLHQERTCVSSRLCAFEMISGFGLQSGDNFMVLDTCSIERTVHRFQRAGALTSATGDGRSVIWGNTSISSA